MSTESPSATSASQASEPRPSRAELLTAFGDDYLTVPSLFRFCFVPGGRLSLLRERALGESWGQNHFVLLKYLATHVRLAIEQGCYAWNGPQIVMAAGGLGTDEGAALFLGMVPNETPDENPWVLNWVGERPSCAELPPAPDLGEWPVHGGQGDVRVACDLTSKPGVLELVAFEALGSVARCCLIEGAVHWALMRGLAVRQLHGSSRGHLVPVFVGTRGDLRRAPDAVAVVAARGNESVVRHLSSVEAAYPSARLCVGRPEELPAWLLSGWDAAMESSDGVACDRTPPSPDRGGR